MKQFKRNQKGFTLVEIAIVLVIIGLLLGGVLKGQEMIENTRIKSIVNDMNGISAAYNSYLDRYRALPGDELSATMTARGWGATGAAGDGNGVLAILPADTFTNGGEQAAMWRALRASQIVTGDPNAPTTATGLPRAGTGGLIGVSVGPYALGRLSVCVSGVTTKQAAGVDTIIDGQVPATNIGNNIGTLRGLSNTTNPLAPIATAAAASAYADTNLNPWSICRSL